MGKYRYATLLPAESCTTAGTKTIDLDVNDPISKITLVYKATSAGTALSAHPAGNVSKIEIVDGADVIASLSGYECIGLDFYNNKVMPSSYMCDVSGVQAFNAYNINFGRKLWDTVLALDPSKFRNPQLKITHNYQTADASASAATMAVYAHMFDDKKIAPVGFLRPVETYAYTCGADDSVETIDLPRDMPIRQLMLRAALADYYPYQVADKIKIEENGGAKVPFDFSSSDWLKFINQRYPAIWEPAALAVNVTARDIYAAPTFTCEFAGLPSTVTNILSREVAHTTIPFKIDITASDTVMGHFTGWQPHYCFPIPFGEQDDIDDWFNPTALSALKMKVTAGAAGASGQVQVVAEQLRKY
jgi:hypothetical protein